MAAMRRADRQDANSDNARNNPKSKREEPASPHELNQLLVTVRSQRDEMRVKLEEKQRCLQETDTQLVHIQQEFQTALVKVDEWKERTTQNYKLYIEEQKNYQQTLCLYDEERTKTTELLVKVNEWRERTTQNHKLYIEEQKEEQKKYQQTLCLYDEEKIRATDLLAKYETAEAQRTQYLILYNETQAQLKYERRSKAGVKGWQTRRQLENDRLKKEIGEMTVLLRESLTRKDEAVNSLYSLAERMDRIQQLVDSVEEESTGTPINLLQKLRRIWLTIKDILTE